MRVCVKRGRGYPAAAYITEISSVHAGVFFSEFAVIFLFLFFTDYLYDFIIRLILPISVFIPFLYG